MNGAFLVKPAVLWSLLQFCQIPVSHHAGLRRFPLGLRLRECGAGLRQQSDSTEIRDQMRRGGE